MLAYTHIHIPIMIAWRNELSSSYFKIIEQGGGNDSGHQAQSKLGGKPKTFFVKPNYFFLIISRKEKLSLQIK